MKFKKKFLVPIYVLFLFGIIELGCTLFIHLFPNRIILQRYKKDWLEVVKEGDFLYRPHHYYGLELNPDYRVKEKLVNEFGLRGPGFPLQKADNEFRIACLGGSTTQGFYISSSTYPERLQDQLRQLYPEREISVINGGVGTYTTAETLIAYLFKISYLSPDLLIVYHGVNDVLTAHYRENYPDYRQYRKVWENKCHPAPWWLLQAQEYSNGLKVFLSVFYPCDDDIWAYSLRYPDLNEEEALANIEKESFGWYFQNNLQRLITLAQAEGQKVILTTFIMDTGKEVSSAVNHRGVVRLNELLRRLAADNGVYLLDLENIYRANPPNFPIFFDDIHFTREGNIWRAGVISEFIARNNIIPSDPPRTQERVN